MKKYTYRLIRHTGSTGKVRIGEGQSNHEKNYHCRHLENYQNFSKQSHFWLTFCYWPKHIRVYKTTTKLEGLIQDASSDKVKLEWPRYVFLQRKCIIQRYHLDINLPALRQKCLKNKSGHNAEKPVRKYLRSKFNTNRIVHSKRQGAIWNNFVADEASKEQDENQARLRHVRGRSLLTSNRYLKCALSCSTINYPPTLKRRRATTEPATIHFIKNVLEMLYYCTFFMFHYWAVFIHVLTLIYTCTQMICCFSINSL